MVVKLGFWYYYVFDDSATPILGFDIFLLYIGLQSYNELPVEFWRTANLIT